MVTKAQVINWAKGLADRRASYDSDGVYGAQCVDIPNGAGRIFFGKGVLGNAIDLLGSAARNGWKVERSGMPKAGAFFVARVPSHGYGHTGLVISDPDSAGRFRTVEQNVTGGSIALGGPATYLTRTKNSAYMTIIGWFYPPYSDLNSSSSLKPAASKPNTATVTATVKQINYGQYNFSAANLKTLLKYCGTRNILPSGVIAQLYLESWWGNSAVGRADKNWGGFTGGAQTRPSGVRVTTGSYRPANEGGTYMRYANMDDFFNDYTYTISTSLYRVAGKKDIESYTKGLFRVGGAVYDYAAVGYNAYVPQMRNLRNGINSKNGGYLDTLDKEFKNGNLVKYIEAVGSAGGNAKAPERETESMDFLFNIKEDKGWDPNTWYYYNGAINSIQPVHNTEELKYIKAVYKESTGRTLKEYHWTSKAPVYVRVFGVVRPGSDNAAIIKAIEDLRKQLESEI